MAIAGKPAPTVVLRIFSLIRGELQSDAQAAFTQVLQTHFAPMAVGNVARNPQPQPVTLLLAGQAKVQFKHLLQSLLRHAWAFIIHVQDELHAIVLDMQMRVLPVLERVVDQVADATLERQRLAWVG